MNSSSSLVSTAERFSIFFSYNNPPVLFSEQHFFCSGVFKRKDLVKDFLKKHLLKILKICFSFFRRLFSSLENLSCVLSLLFSSLLWFCLLFYEHLSEDSCLLFCSLLFCSLLFSSLLFCSVLFSSVLFSSLLFCSLLFSSLLLSSLKTVFLCSILFCAFFWCS